MFKRTSNPMSFMNLAKKVLAGTVRFDLEVQRRGCWTLEQQQDLIESLIFDYPIPPLYFVEKGDANKWALDGQQRSLAVKSFYNDEFAMKDFLPNWIDDTGKAYKVEGLTYSQLDEELKIKINSTNIDTFSFTNISEEEITKMFKNLNAGTPFTKMEIIRIDMPSELSTFINEVSRNIFFSEKVVLSDKSRIHFSDSELILQALMVFNNEDSGVSAKEIKEFTVNGIVEEDVKEKFMQVLAYMNLAFLEKVSFLKKSNVPVMFKVAEIAMDTSIDPQDFFVWATDFFKGQKAGSKYKETTRSGSATQANTEERLEILQKHFTKNINNAQIKRADSLVAETARLKKEALEALKAEANKVDVVLPLDEAKIEDKPSDEVSTVVDTVVVTETVEEKAEEVVAVAVTADVEELTEAEEIEKLADRTEEEDNDLLAQLLADDLEDMERLEEAEKAESVA